MDNKSIVGILYETADLLEVDGQDSFRIRSYRNAAEAIEGLSQQITDLMQDPKQILAIPGIGKGMAASIRDLETHMLGELIRPGHDDYDSARRVHNLEIERRPQLIARVGDAADVVGSARTRTSRDRRPPA